MLLFIPRSLCALKRVAAKTEHHRFGGRNWEREKAIVCFAPLPASLASGHGGRAAWRLRPKRNPPPHSCGTRLNCR